IPSARRPCRVSRTPAPRSPTSSTRRPASAGRAASPTPAPASPTCGSSPRCSRATIAGGHAQPSTPRHRHAPVARFPSSPSRARPPAPSGGRPYGEAIREANGARRWWVAGTDLAPEFLALTVVDAAHLDPDGLDIVFAAVESDAARELEPMYARAVPVISTAAAFRSETDTPIALPGVNVAAHLPLLQEQRRRRGWKGFV